MTRERIVDWVFIPLLATGAVALFLVVVILTTLGRVAFWFSPKLERYVIKKSSN